MNERYEKGLAVRKQVLGGSQVEATVKAAESALNEDLQKYLTEFVWGDIWSRPEMSLRDRSLVTLGMLMALNRSVELKTHIRGALNNGLSIDEIAEVFLHGAAYCGFPAAMTSLRLAKEVVAANP
ncbi:MAG: carboxymuconolactone decarboxylase family protein [Burkholderiaceae bacterium]